MTPTYVPVEVSQIARWAGEGESDRQEFKESTGQRTEAAKTLCGMVNLHGGRLLFGVTPDGRVAGQEVRESTLEKLYEALRAFDPEVTPTIETVEIEPGRHVIVVTVRQGRYRPYRYRGTAYKRVGAVTTEMGREEYQRLFLEQVHASDRWEIEPAKLTLDDLDFGEIVRTLEDAIARGRIGDPFSRDPVEVLRGFGLVKNGRIINAAVALFGRSDRLLPDYPQCLIKLARFRGVVRGERMVDERQEHGNAFALLRRAEEFCRQHLPIAAQLDPDSMVRLDEPEIPLLALREALANAVSHRDCSNAAGSISVFIYDDRIEVTSIGPLHFGLSVADLYVPHESQPWNPLIAGTLYRRGVVDSLGSGVQRMIRLVEGAGQLTPRIEDTGTSVRVEFWRPGATPQWIFDLGLPRSAFDVLVMIFTRRESVALRDIVAALQPGAGLSERDVRDLLQRLRDADLIMLHGRGRGARWTSTSRGRSLATRGFSRPGG
ncbi:RNA-binding domain-containing protein [Frankia sp. Cas3]|uniref:RNA-binding domain-containing protein n=1 Tax=Frankia sp. Cas3 TaxID=3073926 RepID=UPI002AD3E850|nr:RNA-binding domain-containing protein [Frankia sp. Cas3]